MLVVVVIVFVVVSGDEKADEKLRLLQFDSLYLSYYSIHYSHYNLLFYSIKKANLTG